MTDTSVAARADAGPANDVGGIAADRLRSFVERIERLEEEKKGWIEKMCGMQGE